MNRQGREAALPNPAAIVDHDVDGRTGGTATSRRDGHANHRDMVKNRRQKEGSAQLLSWRDRNVAAAILEPTGDDDRWTQVLVSVAQKMLVPWQHILLVAVLRVQDDQRRGQARYTRTVWGGAEGLSEVLLLIPVATAAELAATSTPNDHAILAQTDRDSRGSIAVLPLRDLALSLAAARTDRLERH